MDADITFKNLEHAKEVSKEAWDDDGEKAKKQLKKALTFILENYFDNREAVMWVYMYSTAGSRLEKRADKILDTIAERL